MYLSTKYSCPALVDTHGNITSIWPCPWFMISVIFHIEYNAIEFITNNPPLAGAASLSIQYKNGEFVNKANSVPAYISL